MKKATKRTFLFGLFTILGAISLVPGIVATCHLVNDGATTEDLIKSDIVSIVSFVVTVWAGLNIANYLDKKDYESFENDVRKSLEKKKNTYKKLSKKLKSKSDELDDLRINMEKNLLEQFLSALLKSRKDILTLYFYEQFRCESTLYSASLIAIENYFAQAFMFYWDKR